MEDPNVPLQKTLLPALLQCFGITFIGFILGKTKVLGKSESCGLSIFVQRLSLPALIFMQVSTVAFTEVKWGFVAAVFFVKGIIFISIVLISILLTHPIHLGKAGIYAIAATQSNDFALGYPLLVSLYHNTHPEYPLYLYIIAPIQILILNTIGFFLMETEKKTQSSNRMRRCYFFYILKDTIQNPVIFMTILGLIWNISFEQKVLPILGPILNAFSSAFPATALLLLGYTMTEHDKKNNPPLTLPVIVIIIMKNLVFPLLLQKCTSLMLQGSTKTVVENLSCFGFLYGTLPTAPSVYVFASQYCMCVDTITKIIIGSTLLSAPLMFASASVISLSEMGIKNLSYYLSQTISYLSIFNIFCCIWLILVFWMEKRWRNISFGITFYIVFAQFFMSIGGIMLFFSPNEGTPLFYAQYVLRNGSIYCTSFCTLLLAILLVIIRIRSLCFILQIKVRINIFTAITCCIVPYAITAFLLFSRWQKIDEPMFQLGSLEIITTFVIRLFCLIGTTICLILHQVYLKRNIKYSLANANSDCYQSPDEQENGTVPQKIQIKASCTEDIEDLASIANVNCNECSELIPEETHEVCDIQYHCSASRRIECAERVSQYINDNNEIGTGLNDNENFFKHVSFLIVLSLAMTVSVFTCLGKLILDDRNGIFIEIEFLDCIVNYCVGILCFIIFGLDSNLLNTIKLKCSFFKKIFFNNEKQRIFEIFCGHYECLENRNKRKTIQGVEYTNVFTLDDVVTWLVELGVTNCRNEALSYAQGFLDSKLITEFSIHKTFNKPLYTLNNF